MQVAEEPVGTWLCPSCSPSAAFYIQQLVKARAVTPSSRKARKAARPTSSSSSTTEKDPEPGATKGKVARKGVAVKKSVAEKPKPKPRWVGWIELPSEDEEEYKKKVDAKWMENSVKGKRRGASKAVSEEDGTGARRLGAHSKPGENVKKAVETDSEDEESIYQQEEEEEEEERASISEEASVRDEESANEETSDHHEDVEDTMDMDEGTGPADNDSSSAPSDHAPSSGEVALFEAEDLEDSMDMEADWEESLGANGSDQSSISEYVDNDDGSTSTEIPADTSNARNAADASSLSPEATPASSPAGSSVVFLDEYVVVSDDSMDVDEEDEVQDDQSEGFVIVTRPVESETQVALYQRQGNCWGEFPESAIRSTLPRLA